MKDFLQMWSRVSGKTYASVRQRDREMREVSHNRLRRDDIERREGTPAECEGLNARRDEPGDFRRRKDAIINRLFEQRRKGQLGRQPKNLFIFLMLGFIALGSGCFILILHPYDILFKLKAVLSEGGEIYEMWRKPEVELYTKIYLFNVTNAEDYLAGRHDKLLLQEVGPYVYREKLEHKNVTFNKNGTLSAVPVHPLSWVEHLSRGHREDDVVIMPNIALLSIAHVVSQKDFFTRMGLNTLIASTRTQPLVKMTAKEFMFGYKSSLVSLGNSFMPGWIKFDKLGLIDRMYDFEGDFETVFTGETDVSLSGVLDTYRGSRDLPHWTGEHCSRVTRASDGTKFQSNVGRNDSILFYRKSLCRPATLVPVEEGHKSGLFGYRYTFPDHMLDNGKYTEENKCFCRNGNCLPDGLIDVTDCYYGFPIALSYPHFYQGEERLFQHVEGLKPVKEKHQTNFWINPDAGLPLDVSSKFQINMALRDISSITNSQRFANMYLPLLWFDICMFELPPSMAYRFRMYLNVLPVVEQAAMYLLFLFGVVLILITVYRLAFKLMFRSDTKKHNNLFFGTELWTDDKRRDEMMGIYAPCEVPIDEVKIELERRPSGFIKTHTDRIKEISMKLNDKVYDSVGSIKDKIRDIPHVKHIFDDDRAGSLIEQHGVDNSNVNDGFRSDDDDEDDRGHSDDECRYLEVIDDGSQFDDLIVDDSSRRRSYDYGDRHSLSGLNGTNSEEDLMISSSTDLRCDK